MRQKETQSALKTQQRAEHQTGMRTNQYLYITVSCVLQDFRDLTDKATDEAYSGPGMRKV